MMYGEYTKNHHRFESFYQAISIVYGRLKESGTLFGLNVDHELNSVQLSHDLVIEKITIVFFARPVADVNAEVERICKLIQFKYVQPPLKDPYGWSEYCSMPNTNTLSRPV